MHFCSKFKWKLTYSSEGQREEKRGEGGTREGRGKERVTPERPGRGKG